MSRAVLTLSGGEGRLELPAELSLRGHLLRLSYRLPDADADERLLFSLDAEGRPLSLRRSSPAVLMFFLPGESRKGFLMTSAGRLDLEVRTGSLDGLMEKARGSAKIRYCLLMGEEELPTELHIEYKKIKQP